MKPPHGGVGQSDGLLVIAHGRPHVYIRAATQKPRRRKGPGGASAHAVSDVPRTHRKPPCHYAGVLTRALRGPYGADKFAHFDTKNSVLYRVYATTRKSSGEMIRKLSVIRS